MRTAIRRAVLWGAVLILAVSPSVLGCGSSVGSPTTAKSVTAATVSSSVGHPAFGALTTGQTEDPLVAQKSADLIVYGKVVQIDPARWNSPDGNAWKPKDPSGMSVPATYQTVYVQPTEILKGTPKWGTPVAFMVVNDGTPGSSPRAVAVGNAVLVIGQDYMSEGGLYGKVYWKDDAYFAQDSYTSIYVMMGGELVKATRVSQMLSSYYDPNAPKGNEISTVALSALREAIAKQRKGIDSTTPTLVPLPTTTT